MAIPTLTLLPTAPTTADPATFRARGDAFLSSLNTFDSEMNTTIGSINTILPAIDVAVANANFQGTWNSATAYTVGQSVVLSGITYVAILAGTNQNPSTATTYWMKNRSDASIYRNRIINGANNVNQINGITAVTPTGSSYVGDQWSCAISQASKLTFQQVTDAPEGFKYSTKVTIASQYSPLATDYFMFQQRIEGQNITDFAFGTAGAVTLNTSNWIKGSVAGTYSVVIYNGSGRSYIGAINVTTTWTKVSITLVGDTTGTWNTDNTIGLIWALDLGSGSNFNTTSGTWQAGNFLRTAGSVTFVNQVAGSTLNITGVQLEKVPTGATQGTEYEWLSYEEEERRCARYLPVISCGSGFAFGLASLQISGSFSPPSRVIPTGVTVKTLGNITGSAGSPAVSSVIFAHGSLNGYMLNIGSATNVVSAIGQAGNLYGAKYLLTGAQL